jgi:hypothetical protein
MSLFKIEKCAIYFSSVTRSTVAIHFTPCYTLIFINENNKKTIITLYYVNGKNERIGKGSYMVLRISQTLFNYDVRLPRPDIEKWNLKVIKCVNISQSCGATADIAEVRKTCQRSV